MPHRSHDVSELGFEEAVLAYLRLENAIPTRCSTSLLYAIEKLCETADLMILSLASYSRTGHDVSWLTTRYIKWSAIRSHYLTRSFLGPLGASREYFAKFQDETDE